MYSAEEERSIFRFLCNEADLELIEGKVEMTYEDFERIIYILDALHFCKMEMELWNRLQGKFDDEPDEWEAENFNIKEEAARYTKWLVNFCEAAPDETAKDRLARIFEL